MSKQFVHRQLLQTQFSACVSGKCHHLKSDRKRKEQRLSSVAIPEEQDYDQDR